MKLRLFKYIALLWTLIAGACFVQAQTHYPAGVEGVKGSSLPPPGFYIRDYHYTYYANKFEVGPPQFELYATVQSPRFIYISGEKFLGGYYGMDVIVPFVFQDLDMTGFRDDDFRVGDVFIEPITLSWHQKQVDYSFGYGIWAPTGSYKPTDPVSPGKGFFGHMLTGGITYYPDKEKTWSISTLNRYEFNQERKQTKITPGQFWTLEWGIAKSVSKTVDVGLVGFHQLQTTSAKGVGAAIKKENASGIGPEVNLAIPMIGLSTSFRYLREVGVDQRPEGHIFNLTFTHRF